MPKFLGALAPIVALAVVGCGGDGSSAPPPTGGGGMPVPSPSPSPSPTPTPTQTPSASSLSIEHAFGVVQPDLGAPSGPLFQASDGNFYGLARASQRQCRPIAPISCGGIFRYSPPEGVSVFFTFGETSTDGFLPTGRLIQASDGDLYGLTDNGGAFGGGGTVFKISLNGDYTLLHSFGNGEFDGDTPLGGLVEASDGNFYGITASGGDNTCPEIPSGVGNCGTIFRMAPNGDTQIMHSFGDPSSSTEGVSPDGPLVQGPDGSLYGVTQGRGANGFGTIFKMSLDGEVEHFFSFGPEGDHPGSPQRGLMRASDGNIYGSTGGGGLGMCGPRGCGTIFRISPNYEVTVIYQFGLVDGPEDGRGPDGFLLEGRDGALYGSTRRGGSVDINGGTIFRLTKGGEKTTLASFGPFLDRPTQPFGGLAEGADGEFFGTTESGGNDFCQGAQCPVGALFRFGPD